MSERPTEAELVAAGVPITMGFGPEPPPSEPAVAYLTLRLADGREVESGLSLAFVLQVATAACEGKDIDGVLNGEPITGAFVSFTERTTVPKARVAAALADAKAARR